MSPTDRDDESKYYSDSVAPPASCRPGGNPPREIAIEPLERGVSDTEIKRRLWNLLLEVVPVINSLSKQGFENTAYIITLTHAVRDVVEGLKDLGRKQRRLTDEFHVMGLRLQKAEDEVEQANTGMRAIATSQTDFAQEIIRAAQEKAHELAAQVRDPRNPMTSERAMAIAKDVVENLQEKKDLERLKTQEKVASERRWELFKAIVPPVIVALLLGAGATMFAWFKSAELAHIRSMDGPPAVIVTVPVPSATPTGLALPPDPVPPASAPSVPHRQH